MSLDSQKEDIVSDLIKLWHSDEVKLKTGERHQRLRPEILSRLLSVVMTDDERAEYFGLPKGCRIRDGAKIISPTNLICGEHVWIGENAILDASGGLEIGAHTSIGLSVFVWSHTSQLTNLTLANFSGSPLIERKRTKIGNGVFIAGPGVILPGVTVGDKVIVAPLSVVNKDIPPYSVISGNPARIVKTLTEEDIAAERERVLSDGLGKA
ncbi:MAG: acyltransferase [Curvibacter sp.]|jgi:acetyltransferase-like isoleucine patch superfamily enzyme|nr:acyltransferase [Curvibacter sp.]